MSWRLGYKRAGQNHCVRTSENRSSNSLREALIWVKLWCLDLLTKIVVFLATLIDYFVNVWNVMKKKIYFSYTILWVELKYFNYIQKWSILYIIYSSNKWFVLFMLLHRKNLEEFTNYSTSIYKWVFFICVYLYHISIDGQINIY